MHGCLRRKIAVIGGGIGGLVAATSLAVAGCDVVLLERQKTLGGKMRVLGPGIDAGPTVFTMRWVFEEIFAAAGADFAQCVTLQRAHVLARHAWGPSERLDLFADLAQTADAIGVFAGAGEARGFLDFSDRAKRIYDTLEKPFLRADLPTPLSLTARMGLRGLPDLIRITPFGSLSRALEKHFADPRLRQLFGRYATYCGSSPYLAPATLMLVAHVERDGVWLVQGGMYRLVEALGRLATARGVEIRCDAPVARIESEHGRAAGVTLESGERIVADAVVLNGDPAALPHGFFGEEAACAVRPVPPAARSQSAITWTMAARAKGFPLARHNVFFSDNYAAEFDDVFARGRPPASPTIYVCAQDRDDSSSVPQDAERLFCLINAPANGDTTHTETGQWTQTMLQCLQACGLTLQPVEGSLQTTTPDQFATLFPGTGGALYGQAVHGPMATFRRPGARTKLPGLYLAGGATHPGAGVPMAALSGRLAAARIIADGVSTRR